MHKQRLTSVCAENIDRKHWLLSQVYYAAQNMVSTLLYCIHTKKMPPGLCLMLYLSLISLSFLDVLMCQVYSIRPWFESNSSQTAVFKGAIVRLAGERSPLERRINVEWLTSLCWRNELSIHSQASRGETSFRKVNTIWQDPTTSAKAQHGTVSKDGTLPSSPESLLSSWPPVCTMTQNTSGFVAEFGLFFFSF